MQTYISELPFLDFKNHLNNIVTYKSNNATSILRQFIKMDLADELVGEVKDSNLHVWTYTAGRLPGTGIFFPIIDGQFRSYGEQTILKLTARMNVIGKIILYAIILVLASAIITGIIIQEDNSMKFLINRTLAGTFLFSLFMAVPYLSFQHLKKLIIKSLSNELKLKKTRGNNT
jgi:hypothetical protein